MVGNMGGTSLGMASAFLVGQLCSKTLNRQWQAMSALEGVRLLNEHFLEGLVALASIADYSVPAIVAQDQTLWAGLDTMRRARAARHSVLLFDMGFRDLSWWCGLVRADATSLRAEMGEGVLPRERAIELARETLVLAWSTARGNPRAAALLFGMSDSVVALIGSLMPQAIDRIAEANGWALCPRWPDRPDFWHALLKSAQAGDYATLRVTHYRPELLGL